MPWKWLFGVEAPAGHFVCFSGSYFAFVFCMCFVRNIVVPRTAGREVGPERARPTRPAGAEVVDIGTGVYGISC